MASKKKTFRILATLLGGVVFAAAGAGGYWLYANRIVGVSHANASAPTDMLGNKRGEESKSVSTPPARISPDPIYMPLDPFTVTLRDEYSSNVLYVGFTLRLDDLASRQRIEKHLPELRSRILLELTNQSPELIRSKAGREALLAKIANIGASPFSMEQQPQMVANVLLTQFVVQ